ncbi:uncharacterized protein TNCT_334241 [Trichonephila clavata]|uniref:Uncharacterized protein n=1 Tax=Trichonephila clavata TaxID=2740835 RepID=A0A8X6GHJ6_TRICU|nr:uncharacterized protein TNCT_334241 [Trichonephila clavata]
MYPGSLLMILAMAFVQLNFAKSRNSLQGFSLYKRPLDDSTIDRNILPYATSYDKPSMMNNYLAFLSRLAKKDMPTEDRPSADTHSPKRDNRKFQTQGWR